MSAAARSAELVATRPPPPPPSRSPTPNCAVALRFRLTERSTSSGSLSTTMRSQCSCHHKLLPRSRPHGGSHWMHSCDNPVFGPPMEPGRNSVTSSTTPRSQPLSDVHLIRAPMRGGRGTSCGCRAIAGGSSKGIEQASAAFPKSSPPSSSLIGRTRSGTLAVSRVGRAQRAKEGALGAILSEASCSHTPLC
jgi:hypothetical protein